ncbi:MAG: Flp family type IVb pilin [Hyphomicrobiaceae bacterium]|jgi:Flp pilus assembly pilin Flp
MFARSVKRFLPDAAAIEFGLIAALIAIAIIGGAQALGINIGFPLDTVAHTIK